EVALHQGRVAPADADTPNTRQIGSTPKQPRCVPLSAFAWRTRFRSVSGLMPRSAATCAIGRPLSSASRTPRSNSSSGYFLGLDMAAEDLLSPGQHPGIEVPRETRSGSL